jgi:hypothetical protein
MKNCQEKNCQSPDLPAWDSKTYPHQKASTTSLLMLSYFCPHG